MAIRRGREPGTFVVEFQQGGSRVFRRLPKGITRAQAQDYETKLRREAFDGVLGRREVTIAEAIGQWLSANTRRNPKQAVSEARQWEPWAGRLLREAPEVAQEAVRAWTARSTGGSAGRPRVVTATPATLSSPKTQKPNGWPGGSAGSKWTKIPVPILPVRGRQDAKTRAFVPTSATINRRLALLKAVLKHTWKQGQIGENLSGRISLLREDNKREVYLTREEVARLAKHAPSKACSSAIMLAAFTGLRASELLALTKPTGSALTTGTALVVSQSKSGKPRRVPVPPSARALLRELPLGLSYWQLHKEFGRAKRAAKMPHVKFHDLRHTCASWLINAGVDLYTVGKILGHSGPATTARYAHLSTQTLEKAMARLK